MIKAYSQILSPPYSGLAQVVESDRARAITIDGKSWEFHFLHDMPVPGKSSDGQYHRRFRRVATILSGKLKEIAEQSTPESRELDDRILELALYLSTARFPFPPADLYEFWILDPVDDSPLALIFSCVESEQMSAYPNKTEWTALPASVMPVERTPEEETNGVPPVNYRIEQLVTERAGYKPRGQWFKRREGESDSFPSLLLKEDWEKDEQSELCQRYLERLSTRLLMLHDLGHDDRERLEVAARPHVFEVERFSRFYPDVIDDRLMSAILVEARLKRGNSIKEASMLDRRDGVLYR